jgi:hypothetical protein
MADKRIHATIAYTPVIMTHELCSHPPQIVFGELDIVRVASKPKQVENAIKTVVWDFLHNSTQYGWKKIVRKLH